MKDFGDKLYISHGVVWRTAVNQRGIEFIADSPLCLNETCRMVLQNIADGYFCVKCNKKYQRKKTHSETKKEVQDSWEGFQTFGQPVYSLDLPPTKVVDGSEDENYWVQARISEKQGKRMAVIYFGERIKGKQEKDDYVQIFLDFKDEQLRFDKTNKNPMRLLTKLTAEFPESTINVERRNDKL